MSNEVEASTSNGQPDPQAAPKAPSKKEKKKGMEGSSWSVEGARSGYVRRTVRWGLKVPSWLPPRFTLEFS